MFFKSLIEEWTCTYTFTIDIITPIFYNTVFTVFGFFACEFRSITHIECQSSIVDFYRINYFVIVKRFKCRCVHILYGKNTFIFRNSANCIIYIFKMPRVFNQIFGSFIELISVFCFKLHTISVAAARFKYIVFMFA